MTEDKRPGIYNKEKGSWGEERAAAYLKEQGYAIRERNYRGKTGEIDIIAEKDGTLHFIEVKTRTSEEMGEPLEAIDRRKLDHILRTAELYLYENDLFDRFVCIDGIGINGEDLVHIEGITF